MPRNRFPRSRRPIWIRCWIGLAIGAHRAARRSHPRHIRILPDARADHARADREKRFQFVAIEARLAGRRTGRSLCAAFSVPPSEWTAFARFPTWMWRNAEVRDFVEWLREHNGAAEQGKRVAFHGLDLYSLYDSIRSVLNYLDEVDPESAKVARERYGCLTPWQRDPATYGHAALTGPIRPANAMWRARSPICWKAPGLCRARWRALPRCCAECASGRQCRALLSHHVLWLARIMESARQPHVRNAEEPAGVSWRRTARPWSGRTTRMSATPRRPRWRRAASTISASFAARNSATQAYLIGFGTNSGTVAAASEWDGPMEIKTVRPALANSYEQLCHATGLPRFMLGLRGRGDLCGPDGLGKERLERAIGVIYRPETELASHYFQAILPQQFDEYIWFDETQRGDPAGDGRNQGTAGYLSVRSVN